MIYKITGMCGLSLKRITFLVESDNGKNARDKIFSHKDGKYLKRETIRTTKMGKIIMIDRYNDIFNM